jgi:hypothetical protein
LAFSLHIQALDPLHVMALKVHGAASPSFPTFIHMYHFHDWTAYIFFQTLHITAHLPRWSPTFAAAVSFTIPISAMDGHLFPFSIAWMGGWMDGWMDDHETGALVLAIRLGMALCAT